jgi:hypothetical protein
MDNENDGSDEYPMHESGSALKRLCRAKTSIRLDLLKNPEEADDNIDAIRDQANPNQANQCKLIVAKRISHSTLVSPKVRKR